MVEPPLPPAEAEGGAARVGDEDLDLDLSFFEKMPARTGIVA